MHFLLYFPPIDVLSLLHSFVFALHISRILSLTSRHSAKTAREAELRLLVVARLYRHGRCLVHIQHPDMSRLHPHTNTILPHSTFTPPFMLSVPACVIYIVHVLLYHHHFAAHPGEQQ